MNDLSDLPVMYTGKLRQTDQSIFCRFSARGRSPIRSFTNEVQAMLLKEKFFSETPPTARQTAASQHMILAENAVASTIFSLGTGNFLTGYLTWMGASPAFSALVGALPMLGCVLQAVSPFLFERLRHRKLCIVLLCFGFRCSMGLAVAVPFLLRAQTSRLSVMFLLYLIAFLFAGFVTPGLNQWMLDSAPMEGRGRFFAKKNILASVTNAGLTFAMGLQLDHFIGQGHPETGYLIVYGTILLLALADAAMLSSVWESPSGQPLRVRLRDFLRPFRDPVFRPVILFDTLWFIANHFSAAFLAVYLLQGLGLSHGYISILTIVSSVAGMGCNWIWGRMADRKGWRAVLAAAGGVACCGYAGWCIATPATAPILAPLLQCVSTAGSAAANLATLNLQYAASPREGKTVYLGAVAVVSNLMGYAAALAASSLQTVLQPGLGIERSISVLFAVSAAGMLVCLLYAVRRLPKL